MRKFALQFVRITLMLAIICSGQGNVLCYGNDGHIALEPALHNHCQHDFDDQHEDSHTQISDQCSPCVDVFISTDIEPARIQFSTLYHLASPHIAAVNTTTLLKSSFDTQNRVITPFFTPLKTIILRT